MVDPNGARNTPIIYDWAKLSHSILGKYDLIISDQFFLEIRPSADIALQVSNHVSLHKEFHILIEEFNISLKDLRRLESYLFCSMCTFHKENLVRCLAFLDTSKKIRQSIGG